MASKVIKRKATDSTPLKDVAELHVERMKLTLLKPHPRNPRKHPKQGSEEWDVLRKSLEHDYFDPLVWNKTNGMLVSGHLRRKVFSVMGIKVADVVVVEYDEPTHLARMIAANKPMGKDNYIGLKSIFSELGTITAFDMNLTGFTKTELKDPVADGDAPDMGVADVSDISAKDLSGVKDKWKVKKGQLWDLGGSRLLCGDCTVEADVNKLFGEGSAEVCFTSPPYSDQRTYDGVSNMSPEHLATFISASQSKVGTYCINLGISRVKGFVQPYWDHYISDGAKCGLGVLSWNIWSRTSMSIGQATAMFPILHEFIFVLGTKVTKLNCIIPNVDAGNKKSGTSNANPDGSRSPGVQGKVNDFKAMPTVYQCAPEKKSDHPAAFPVRLAFDYVRSFHGDVYEPFSGSGTTLLACHKAERKCYAMEISPEYLALTLQRFLDTTGITPKLIK